MKQAVVFLRGVKAGILTEDENGYTFFFMVNGNRANWNW